MIKVYYAYTEGVSEARFYRLTRSLSEKMQLRLAGYKREEDRVLRLSALYLLKAALMENGYSNYPLADLQYTRAGKPFFQDSPVNFSISHTEKCTVLAFSSTGRIGIDIEKIKSIDLNDFVNILPIAVWNAVNTSTDCIETFYFYWTLLESAAKADGGGLPLLSSNQIKISGGQVFINGSPWYSQHLSFNHTISCCITTEHKQETDELIEMKPISEVW